MPDSYSDPTTRPADPLHSRMPHTSLLLLVAILALHAALCWWAKPVFESSDDLVYATLGNAIKEGTFQLTPSHFIRFGMLLPVALSFSLFGVTPHSTILWTWLCSVGLIMALFWVVRRAFGPLPAVLSAFLVAVNPYQIENVVMLGVDAPVAFFSFATLAMVWRARQDTRTHTIIALALASVLTFYCGIVTKMTTIWITPFLLFLLYRDLRAGRHKLFWGVASLAVTLFAVLYLGIYHLKTGNAFYQFMGIDRASTLTPDQWSYADKPVEEIWRRVTYQPLLMFLKLPGFMTVLIFALPALLLPGLRRCPDEESFRYWGTAFWLVLLAFWFGTRSYSVYNPMHLLPRMWLPLLPLLCIPAGLTLSHFLSRSLSADGKTRLLGPTTLLAVALLALSWGMGLFKGYLLLLLGLLLMVALLQKIPPQSDRREQWLTGSARGIFVVGLTFIPAFFIHQGFIGELPFQRAERRIIAQHLATVRGPATILTESGRSVNTLSYYMQFRPPADWRMESWSPDKESDPRPGERRFLFTRKHLLIKNDPLRQFLDQDPTRFQYRLVDQENGVSLYEKQTGPEPAPKKWRSSGLPNATPSFNLSARQGDPTCQTKTISFPSSI